MGDSDDASNRDHRFACDAMCGGLARWLRTLGYDTTYTADIEDAALVQHAGREARILISADGRLFERRPITTARVRALRLPRGLKLREQVEYVVRALHLHPRDTRCTRCNGVLLAVRAEDVADHVPAKSLTFATEFYRCDDCNRAYWNGTHWQRITRERQRLAAMIRTDQIK